MKKTILIIAACMLVFAFVGVSSAEILKCPSDQAIHHINRGCEGLTGSEQAGYTCSTTPFDFEDWYGDFVGECSRGNSYCETPDKYELHRALFKICDCIDDGHFDADEVDPGDTIDISMEILIDKDGDGVPESDGDNGVYWAENVNSVSSSQPGGVGVETFATQGAACADTSCTPADKFVGEFDYFLGDGTKAAAGTVPYIGPDCDVPDEQEIVKFQATPGQLGAHGYTIQPDDATDNKSVWWVDIPELRVDRAYDVAGWDVYIKICMYSSLDTGGVCGDCEGCCYTINIGTLCCDTTPVVTTCSETMYYPYFAKTSGTYWYGLVVTNLTSEAGTATVTLYEQDGDIFTGSVSVGALSTRVVDQAIDLTLSTTGPSSTGTLGDTKSWAKVVTDFEASGFGMMANDVGSSMGYLAEKCGSCVTCK